MDDGGVTDFETEALPEGAGVGPTRLFDMLENFIDGVGLLGP